MSKMQVQSTTVEENFVFGSPPLLNGFTYNTCRSQEGVVKPTNHDCFSTYHNLEVETTNSTCCLASDENTSDHSNMSSYCHQNKYQGSYHVGNGFNRSTYTGFSTKNGSRSVDLNQLSYLGGGNGRTTSSHVDNGIKILEQAGIKVQKLTNNEPVFKKRKDLRVLKSVLSSERFREVVMKFGDGDEGGKEIVESVHKSMRNSNLSSVSCLFCNSESQVYENFPIVDGTLFLSPVKLSKDCVKFEDKLNGVRTERFMCYVCVGCLEGKPKTLRCSGCRVPWNGSFFQVGTLYSYNILSAIPCCEMKVTCKTCEKAIIDLDKGEASTLYFSHFSSKATCPSCQSEDFHYIKSLDTLTRSIGMCGNYFQGFCYTEE